MLFVYRSTVFQEVMSSSRSDFSCWMCSYSSNSEESMTDHICKLHRNDHRFRVICRCYRTFDKWNSYWRHIKRGCKAVQNEIISTEIPSQESTNTSLNDLPSESDHHIASPNQEDTRTADYVQQDHSQWHQAVYILNMKESHQLPQVAVDHVVASTKVLVEEMLSQLMLNISRSIPNDCFDRVKIEADKLSSDLFKDLSTQYQQEKFFENHFNAVVCTLN